LINIWALCCSPDDSNLIAQLSEELLLFESGFGHVSIPVSQLGLHLQAFNCSAELLFGASLPQVKNMGSGAFSSCHPKNLLLAIPNQSQSRESKLHQ